MDSTAAQLFVYRGTHLQESPNGVAVTHAVYPSAVVPAGEASPGWQARIPFATSTPGTGSAFFGAVCAGATTPLTGLGRGMGPTDADCTGPARSIMSSIFLVTSLP